MFQDGSDRWSTFTPRRRPGTVQHARTSAAKAQVARDRPQRHQPSRTSRSDRRDAIATEQRHRRCSPNGRARHLDRSSGPLPTGRNTTAALSAHTGGKCTGCREHTLGTACPKITRLRRRRQRPDECRRVSSALSVSI